MRTLQRLVVVASLVGLAIAFSCGGAGTEASVTPTGGEVCLGDRKVCIDVPSGGLAESVVLRLSSGSETPGAALSEAFDISASNGKPVKFLLPATVSIRIDIVDANDVPNDALLRLYTRDPDTKEWVALDAPVVNRLRGEITGQTMHLSPFVVLRADRLPDGALPVEIDAGVRDAGVIVIPPVPDAGRPDAGRPRADAGRPDAGGPVDAGGTDAGPGGDAGQPSDSGAVDAGSQPGDSGTVDSGTAVDAGSVVDSGAQVDAGAPDAGAPDAGAEDGGAIDAGDGG